MARTAKQHVERYLALSARAQPGKAGSDNENERATAARARDKLVEELTAAAASRDAAGNPRTPDPAAVDALRAINSPRPSVGATGAAFTAGPSLDELFGDLFKSRPLRREPSASPPRPQRSPTGFADGVGPPPPPPAEQAPWGARGPDPVDPFGEDALRRQRRKASTQAPPPPPRTPPPPKTPPPPTPTPPPSPAPPADDLRALQRQAVLMQLAACLEGGPERVKHFPWQEHADVVSRGRVSYVDEIRADVVLRPGDPVSPGSLWANVAILIDGPRKLWDTTRPVELLREVAALVRHATSSCRIYTIL